MKSSYETHFFLGANTPNGFYSLYDDFVDTVSDRLYVIKAGPGCGKSSFIRKVAEGVHAVGNSVEYIHCSGDPDSLDGAYFPELKAGIVDGTSPHVIEPTYHGATGEYIDIGAFFNNDKAVENRDAVIELTDAYKKAYDRAFKMLAAYVSTSDALEEPADPNTLETVEKRVMGIVSREFKDTGIRNAATKRRFLSAITCRGRICKYETVPELADRVYVFDNDCGYGTFAVEKLSNIAVECGYSIIRCQSPLCPVHTEHLIIPKLDLAFVTQTSNFPYNGEIYRHLRFDAAISKRTAAKLPETIFNEVIESLSKAKSYHDRLEQVNNPYVDFRGISELADKYIDKLTR